MNPSYRRDQDHNYMILNAPMPVTGEEFPVRMLVLNRIPGTSSMQNEEDGWRSRVLL